jgi:hypothetical protein
MQSEILHLSKQQPATVRQLDTAISFNAFIDYVAQLAASDTTMRKRMFQAVLEMFKDNENLTDELSLDDLHLFKRELELIFSLLVPPVTNEKEMYWALAAPMAPTIFYGTDALYDFIRVEAKNKFHDPSFEGSRTAQPKLRNVYYFIFERLYHLPMVFKEELVFAVKDPLTGLSRYFRADFDKRFLDVKPKGELPPLDKVNFGNALDGSEFDWRDILRTMPLSMFTFRGFAVLTVTDITAEQAVENIKNLILGHLNYDNRDLYERVIHSLKTLCKDSSTEFGMLPVVRVNKELVVPEQGDHFSIIADAIRNERLAAKFKVFVEDFLRNPKVVYYNVSSADEGSDACISYLKELGIVAYALIPINYNNNIAGILEVYSRENNILAADSLSRLEPAITLLGQLMQSVVDEFRQKIENTIKEKFTALQPSVQWKFNQVAWQYIKDRQSGQRTSDLSTIVFKNVYPLYGAIDIRNSTIERNEAVVTDFKVLFGLLEEILIAIRQHVGISLADELIFQCKKWLNVISESYADDNYLRMNEFLVQEIVPFLNHFNRSNPELAETIQQYFEAMDEDTGIAFNNRRELERSMQGINTAINTYLEYFRDEIQGAYPCYFEKFRTDGVEYDIYLGQSIVPSKPFSLVYLKNIRLWQLRSMAAVAKMVNELLKEGQRRLTVTMLIFVRSTTIDIAFRMDERKFDVEGAYNIRYQIIKKRIDKVHVRGSGERLTQPGKIAIIYFNTREAEEYEEYISYLQSENILSSEVEHLDLEDLQGVSGLKAIRVSVQL